MGKEQEKDEQKTSSSLVQPLKWEDSIKKEKGIGKNR